MVVIRPLLAVAIILLAHSLEPGQLHLRAHGGAGQVVLIIYQELGDGWGLPIIIHVVQLVLLLLFEFLKRGKINVNN
jgi:hypothetical protein